MKILNWFFNYLDGTTPEGKFAGNWLSYRWHEYKNRKLEISMRKWKESAKDEVVYFEVPGAGEIGIDRFASGMCGEAVGFGFGVSWGRHHFCGGVLGRSEAKRLANFLLEECKKADAIETEEQILLRYENQFTTTK